MLIDFLCTECVSPKLTVYIPANSTGFYEGTCPRGHKVRFILHHQLFEVLFELGLHAINDGYYREAVASFTASLERFYEFYIKVILYKNKIEDKLTEKVWKTVVKQSERQLGAYIFTYLNEKKVVPNILDEPNIAFRNKVTHQGHIPTREQAIDYGKKIFNLVEPVMDDFKEHYMDYVNEMIHNYEIDLTSKHQVTNGILVNMSSMFSSQREKDNKITLEDALAGLSRKE